MMAEGGKKGYGNKAITEEKWLTNGRVGKRGSGKEMRIYVRW
jgi:hypothetical protein